MYYVSKSQSRFKASHRKNNSLCFPFPTHWLSVELISQLSNGTMGMLRLPSPFSYPSISLGSDTTYGTSLFLSLHLADVLTWWTRISWHGSIRLKTQARVEAGGPPVACPVLSGFPCKPLCLWHSPRPRSSLQNLSFLALPVLYQPNPQLIPQQQTSFRG